MNPNFDGTGRPAMGRRAWLMAALASWGAGCSSTKPMKVGFLGGLSGRVSDLGIGGRNGAQMAIDDLNASGGVAGRPWELLVRDDEQNPDTAHRRLEELYELGVELVIGPMTSSVAAAVWPLVKRRGIPMISPLAGANDFSGHHDAFFRVVSDSAASARQQARVLLSRGHRSLVTVADTGNAVFTRNWASHASEQFVNGDGRVMPPIEFLAAPGLRFVTLAQRIVEARADCVVLIASAADSAALVQHIRALRPQQAVALSVWAGTEGLPAMGGQALDGVLVTQFFDRFSHAPRWLAFKERYLARFGEAPGYAAANGHDAVQMGIEAARSQQADGLLNALHRVRRIEGLQRRLDFDPFGDCLAPTYVTEVQGGRYVAVKT